MALIISTWLWGEGYGDHYVKRLSNAVHRNLDEAHRFICLTDRFRHLPDIEQHRISNVEYLDVKGCFARLRLFDPDFQQSLGIEPGDRIVNLDLDLVVTGKLDALFNGQDDFTILQGINTTNPCPYNGSVWMLRAGTRPDVWTDFSLQVAQTKTRIHSFADDQGWFEYKMPDAGAFGPAQGVYGFKKLGWPSGEALPDNARMVAFPGWRDPGKFEHLDWVKQHWR